jgi:hypothetical protein
MLSAARKDDWAGSDIPNWWRAAGDDDFFRADVLGHLYDFLRGRSTHDRVYDAGILSDWT